MIIHVIGISLFITVLVSNTLIILDKRMRKVLGPATLILALASILLFQISPYT